MYQKYEGLLKKTGKTSYQVSKETGIAQSTISDWKTGRSKPKIEKLQILANYFRVSVTYFLEDTAKEAETDDAECPMEEMVALEI